jgi:ribonuclease BN (tRNA processing enzyme)
MRVTILGAGTAIPAKGYSPAGIYVQAGREHLLFDAGPGTAQRLRAAGVSIFDLDRIFLTHYHLDHCLDFASILFALRIPMPRRTKSLVVYGPPGLKKLYRQLNHAFHGWLTPRSYGLALKELKETTLRLPGYTVISRWMNHSAPALGYRVEAGRKRLAYSGDTDACWNLVELGRNTHLLILECSVTDELKVEGHLTPTACGRIAEQANCRRLALTHFYPVFKGYDIRKRVRRHFRGRLTLARDLTSFQL